MKLMIEKAQQSNALKTTRDAFKAYGKAIDYFPGVQTWFARIKEYALIKNVIVEHYIISSGLKEMVEGSSIGKYFKKIFACSFLYNNNDVAVWPGRVVNCTSKTQYLFRINKGIDDDTDTVKLNEYVSHEDRPVPFSRMIYIGDGTTDVPCMRLVKEQGGHSIAVYKPKARKSKATADKLFADHRVNFIAPAVYTAGSPLETLVERIIDKCASDFALERYGKKCKPRAKTGRNCDRHDRSVQEIEYDGISDGIAVDTSTEATQGS